MRSPRLTCLVSVALAAATVGACGSTPNHVSAPAPTPPPPKLRLVASGGEAAAAIYPQRPTTYVLDGHLADLGAHAPVRKLVGHEVTSADAARIADALGRHGTPTSTENGFEVRDGDALLTIDTSAGVTYVSYSSAGGAGVSGGGTASSGSTTPSAGENPTPPDGPATKPPPVTVEPVTVPPPTIPRAVDVPSAEAASSIAQTLLDSLGVLAGQQWAHDVTDANGIAVSCAAGVPCVDTPSPVTARTVTYTLLLDGVRIPGIDWSVTIGEHRRVEAVYGTWARPEDAGAYPLRTTANVFADLQAGRAQQVGMQALSAGAPAEIAPSGVEPIPPIVVHITGVSLAAARWDGIEDQPGNRAVVYLVPTYRFQARVPGSDPYEVEVLALDPATFAVAAPPAGGGPKGGIVPQPAPAPVPEPLPTPVPAPTPTPAPAIRAGGR